ncbi:Peptidyl-prolyl cis-trans isomerase, chloroplastic [Apostasia shenzhenica]|uniref:Peptidyl-prolyl cis-trans isomerase n=1 Tax=Apostasia shenzhenica TaxID=1088818 RepID=A0A2I0AE74_9ASPA|nr:Peptidyl-prolyl cis-trans isomerase, chloroplastic [Apostasia shenzhenica]
MNSLIHVLFPLGQPLAPPPPPSPPQPLPPAKTPPLLRRAALTLALSLPFQSSLASIALAAPSPSPSLCPSSATITSKAFLDVSIDGALAGRITIGLFGDAAPAAAARFAALASGSGGISYRRKEFLKIAPTYIQHAGIRSYGADADLARRSGADLATEGLISDWEAAAAAGCAGVRSAAETVGIVVRDPARPSPATRIVARNGRIVVEEEENGGGPNGTEFVIARKDSPELDAAAVVVGKVVAGMDVVDKIAGVSSVRDNSSSPYFK